MSKSPDAFRTISEVAGELDLPQHVLRFWETRFAQIRPMKRGGGRRYYRPDDVDLLRGIRVLLYGEGYTIRGVQRILKEHGARFVIGAGRGEFTGLPDLRDSGDDEPEDRYGEAPTAAPGALPADEDAGAPDMAQAARPIGVRPMETRPQMLRVAGLAVEDADRLRSTLTELLECKRLLDQAR